MAIEIPCPPAYTYSPDGTQVVIVPMPRVSLSIIANVREGKDGDVTLLGNQYEWQNFDQRIERFTAPRVIVKVSVGDADRVSEERRNNLSHELSHELGKIVRGQNVPMYEGPIDSPIMGRNEVRFQAQMAGVVEKGYKPGGRFRMYRGSDEVFDAITINERVPGGTITRIAALVIGCIPRAHEKVDPSRHGLVVLRPSTQFGSSPYDIMMAAIFEPELPQAAARALTDTGLRAFYAWIRTRCEGHEVSFSEFAPDYKPPANTEPLVEGEDEVEGDAAVDQVNEAAPAA